MITKLIGWLPLAFFGTALAAGSLVSAQDTEGVGSDDIFFYDFYEGGFDEQPDDDDWFYDYYAYAEGPERGGAYAGYDAEADRFDWEEDGVVV